MLPEPQGPCCCSMLHPIRLGLPDIAPFLAPYISWTGEHPCAPLVHPILAPMPYVLDLRHTGCVVLGCSYML